MSRSETDRTGSSAAVGPTAAADHEPTRAPLHLVVLGANGATGRLVVERGLDRGHQVHALVRDLGRYDPDGQLAERGVHVHHADVNDPSSIAAATTPDSVVISTLGVTAKAQVGTLTAGAHAVLAARPRRVVWMGAVGTGRSAGAVRWPTRQLLRAVFGAEHEDKTTADALVLDAGATVVHCGRLTTGAADGWAGMPMARVPTRLWPTSTPRAAAAHVLLAEAERAECSATIVVPQRALADRGLTNTARATATDHAPLTGPDRNRSSS